MRRTISSFVATLCLLTLFVSSAACLALPQDPPATASRHPHTLSAAEHSCCPQRSPAGEHTTTTCCTIHHQPVSSASAVELEQPAIISPTTLLISIQIPTAINPTAPAKIAATQPPPLIALRI
ncbi:hypothetical protein [Edaphobacter aggregans]|uniref:hypothetical protein n=1 Tax=Edaphobacter aggregans TaxID=570835 RepID=UPI00054D0E88|nr:hypothetical protein [Edaphobacter aggregans]